MNSSTRYRDHGDRLDLAICSSCSTRTTVVVLEREELDEHDAWHDGADLELPAVVEYDTDEDTPNPGIPAKAWDAFRSAVATNRALGTTGAKCVAYGYRFDASRRYVELEGIRTGTTTYDVAISVEGDEAPAPCEVCAHPTAHVGWCPIGSTDEERDDRAHVHVEHDATDCDGSHYYTATYRFADSDRKDVDEWLWMQVAELISLSGFGGTLEVRQENPTAYDGRSVSWDLYGRADGRAKIRPETVATWSEPTEEGRRFVELRLCFDRCSA